MIPVTEDVAVRIVSEPWTSDVLAFAAIAISLATLAWTLWARRADQAHIHVSGGISIPVGVPGPAQRLIGLTVTNKGRAGSTVLKHVHLRVGHRGDNMIVTRFAYGQEPTYPKRLEPGESVDLLIDPHQIAVGCLNDGIDPEHLMVVVRTGHGETVAPLAKHCRWLVRDVSARLR